MMSAAVQQVEDDWLGKGIYTPAEAALYARLQTRMLNRWLFDMGGPGVIAPERADDPERVVTFRDFVQAMAVRAIRLKHEISLQKIREAMTTAEREFGLPYPLAREHRIYKYANDIVIRPDKGKDALVQVTGRSKRQQIHAQIAEPFLKDLFFDDSGMANAYTAYRYRGRVFTMDPTVRLGQPILDSCNYSIHALLAAFHSEGSVKRAARALGVKTEDIEAALSYNDHLLPIAA